MRVVEIIYMSEHNVRTYVLINILFHMPQLSSMS